ncbi:MAG TPA: hypothetical protein VNV41_07325 [Candidatus Acidoferrales bacterium]|jgi:hypothetical protein|nr:hypothetical protein [Candidatus Acidoferrales bacterium]
MKKLLGITTIALLFSIPAHAQSRSTSVGSAASASASNGGVGMGSSVGGSSSSRLPIYPRATLDVRAVSGGDPSFAPSTFLSFDQAVAEGKAITDANQKSLAQAASENSSAPKAKAKLSFVQDARGKVVSTTQQ